MSLHQSTQPALGLLSCGGIGPATRGASAWPAQMAARISYSFSCRSWAVFAVQHAPAAEMAELPTVRCGAGRLERVASSSPARYASPTDKGASLRQLRRLCRAQPASVCLSVSSPGCSWLRAPCKHYAASGRQTKKHVMWTTRIKICLRARITAGCNPTEY